MGHMVYSLIPGKGYTTEARASSPEAHEDEFKGLTNSFTPPCHPRLFEEDGFEARMVTCTDRVLFITRFFYCGARFKLDERSRAGLVWHVGAVPRELLSKGLSLRRVEATMNSYLQAKLDVFEVPLGSMERIPLTWEQSSEADPDLDGMRDTIPQQIATRVAGAFEKEYAKAFVRYGDGKTLDRTGWQKRALLTFNFAKFLLKFGIRRPFSVVSEALHQGSILFYPNVVVVSARDEYYTNDPAWVYAVIPKVRSDKDDSRDSRVFGEVYGTGSTDTGS